MKLFAILYYLTFATIVFGFDLSVQVSLKGHNCEVTVVNEKDSDLWIIFPEPLSLKVHQDFLKNSFSTYKLYPIVYEKNKVIHASSKKSQRLILVKANSSVIVGNFSRQAFLADINNLDSVGEVTVSLPDLCKLSGKDAVLLRGELEILGCTERNSSIISEKKSEMTPIELEKTQSIKN